MAKKTDFIKIILKALGKEGGTEEALYEITDNGGYFALGAGLTMLAKTEYYWASVMLAITAILFLYKWHVHNRIYPAKKKK